jgi:integrase
MGRLRTKDRHLPKRVYFERGRYRYKPKEGKPVELGSVYAEAMRIYWSDIAPRLAPEGGATSRRTMGDWGDEYMLKVVPEKGPGTQRVNRAEWKFLRPAFADLYPDDITQQHVYAYMSARGAITRANREKALISHMLTWLVFRGVLKANPLYGMRRDIAGFSEVPRNRLVTDKERDTFVRAGGEKIVLYCRLKELTRMRQGDILTLEVSSLKDEGIEVMPRKSRRRHPRTGERVGKRRIYSWTPELRAIVDRILELKRAQERRQGKITPWLFVTRRGECYYDITDSTADRFRGLWKRTMERAQRLAAVEGWELKSFTEHDLRARAGGSAKLLGNSEAIFRAHYDRVTEVVEPLNIPSKA